MLAPIIVAGSFPPPEGGTTVLLRALTEAIERHGVRVVRVQLGGTPTRRMWGLLRLTCMAVGAKRAKCLSLHVSRGHVAWLVPLYATIAWLRGRRFVWRAFGGDNADMVRELGVVRRYVLGWCLKRSNSLAVLETKMEAQFFGAWIGAERVRQLPNHREVKTPPPRWTREASRKLVFVGRICEEKGLRVLLRAMEELGCEYQLDLIGVWDETMQPDQLPNNVAYRGSIDHATVVDRLAHYGALVLPTRWRGEGHPGVVLEAYAAGLPVIVTRWRSIPEIVPVESPLLCDVNSAHDVVNAVRLLETDPERVEALLVEQGKILRDLGVREWARRFVDWCAGTDPSR